MTLNKITKLLSITKKKVFTKKQIKNRINKSIITNQVLQFAKKKQEVGDREAKTLATITVVAAVAAVVVVVAVAVLVI